MTEFVESSLSNTCTSVYSNYYYQPDNVTKDGSSYIENYTPGNWPCAINNWNYRSTYHQWFITANSTSYYIAWFENMNGAFFVSYYVSSDVIGVRPAFYLKSNVNLTGEGTIANPYRIAEM